jgi:hypothetical protein
MAPATTQYVSPRRRREDGAAGPAVTRAAVCFAEGLTAAAGAQRQRQTVIVDEDRDVVAFVELSGGVATS